MKILFSGFEPFGNDSINPSLEAVKLLEKEKIDGVEIVITQTPVVKNKSIENVVNAIKTHKPDVVVTVGQAGGRAGVSPERVAINVDDYRIKDNEGNQPIDEQIIKDAPNAYFSTLPIKAMVEDLRKNGLPAFVSNTAGTFVCNHLFFGVQHFIISNSLNIRHGFVHIPLLPEQAKDGDKPSMSLSEIVKALVVIAKCIRDNCEDKKIGSGAIC